MERYELVNGMFYLIDPELGIDIQESCVSCAPTPLFYPSGQVEGETFYLEGELHGPSLFFSENGMLLSKGWFYHGQRMGKLWQYYLSGKPYCVQRFKAGVPCGNQEYYYEDGALKTLLPYEEGELHGEVKLFWPDHKLKRTAHFIHGCKDKDVICQI